MIRRRPTRRVDVSDRRSPMLRLLVDGQLPATSDDRVMVAVSYDQQWRTLWKAQSLGYLDANQYLTDAGRAFIAKTAP